MHHHDAYWYRIDSRDPWQPLAARTPDRVTTSTTPAVRRPSALRGMLRRHALWFAAWQRRNA